MAIHRLLAAIQVNDRQATMAECRLFKQRAALTIRPTMGDGIDHFVELS